MTTNPSTLSVEQLKRAIQIKEQVARLQGNLSAIFGGNGSASSIKSKSGMSPARRAKLSTLAKARWAKIKSGKKKSATVGKRTMSAATRARLSSMAKARWARIKSAKAAKK